VQKVSAIHRVFIGGRERERGREREGKKERVRERETEREKAFNARQ
jgi:hypothetical protein